MLMSGKCIVDFVLGLPKIMRYNVPGRKARQRYYNVVCNSLSAQRGHEFKEFLQALYAPEPSRNCNSGGDGNVSAGATSQVMEQPSGGEESYSKSSSGAVR